ncbi:MAG TPA: PfkB family carbohydrate kinase [Caldilineaceae bacterium]|nr:PfkB family carbohydrate kinase [Caldilineaceae bacterium]
MIDFVTYSIIVDDLVFPDGRTAMAVLGGSGPQTAFGMKLWADQVGLVGGIGHDFPATARRWLNELAIDTSGVRQYPHYASLRAWQIFEADGRRTQVWRTQGQAIPDQLALRYEDLPNSYRTARGFHYGVHPEHPNLSIAASLRANGVVVGIEPFKHADRRLNPVEANALVGAGQIFTPNLYEVDTMIGPAEPLVQVQRLSEQGAEIVALRLGADGSILRRGDTGETWHIPSYPTQVVDACGAGNAYCGGLLVGWVQTGDLRLAGLYGAVSASFLVEQIGLPAAKLDEQRASARLRLAQLYPQTRRLDLR